MKSFLYFSTLQEVVARKILIWKLLNFSKGFVEDTLSIWAIIQFVEDPSAVELDNSISAAYFPMVIWLAILVVATLGLKESKIIPNPITIIESALMGKRRVHLDPSRSANADIFLH